MADDVKNPRWINGGTAIMLDVKDGDEFVPFVAMADDVTDHGKVLFEAAKAGQFGEVAPEHGGV